MLTILRNQTAPGILLYFFLKMKSGKWRLVIDLRVVNKIVQPMGPLQSGIPLPSLLPKGWPLIVIDLKDCFFTVHLPENDREKFAFTVPTYNISQPTRRYQWTILPLGMFNSLTLC